MIPATAPSESSPPPLTPAVLYALHRRRLTTMLAWMQEELDTHAQKAGDEAQAWARTSELAQVEALVRQGLVERGKQKVRTGAG